MWAFRDNRPRCSPMMPPFTEADSMDVDPHVEGAHGNRQYEEPHRLGESSPRAVRAVDAAEDRVSRAGAGGHVPRRERESKDDTSPPESRGREHGRTTGGRAEVRTGGAPESTIVLGAASRKRSVHGGVECVCVCCMCVWRWKGAEHCEREPEKAQPLVVGNGNTEQGKGAWTVQNRKALVEHGMTSTHSQCRTGESPLEAVAFT